MIKENRLSIVSFYAEFLFEISLKENNGLMDFFEWIKCVLDFGNLNEESIENFVFKLIDDDNN